MPNPNDPLRTTDHDLSATPAAVVTADFASGSSLADEGTVTHLPGRSTGGESIPASVSVPGYEIESVLGRGGMGVVYKAQHLALKRTVALKLILAGGHAGPHELARFRTEAEAAARLQHPNIVQIYEVGEAGGHPYCALEFVEGGNLASKLDGKPMPAREAAKLMECLARAMQLAHSRNVVHRDLKPANILLTADGTPKITDFGLARQLDSDSSETQAGAVIGTPSYMAPEQASGRAHEAGPAADVYALGAILYDCLAGRPPFKGKSIVETLDQVRTHEPAAPSRWQGNIPLDLETICLKCLRKEPENRYSSAAELADELVRYQHGEPILARPISRRERAVKWARRNPVVAASFSAVLAIFLAAFALVTWSYWRAEDARQDEARQRIEAQERERAERWERYRANIAAASGALQLNNVGTARRALEAAPEEHRNWEWRHFYHQLDGARETLLEQQAVDKVTYSRDGRWLAWTNYAEGRVVHVRLMDLRTARKEVISVGQGDGHVLAMCERTLAFPRADNSIQLWDLETGKVRASLLGHEGTIDSIVFSPDGKRLASASIDQTVRIWDAETGKKLWVLRGHKANIWSVDFSPDGQRLVSAGGEDRTAILWDVTNGQEQARWGGHETTVWHAAFSPDGARVVTAEYYPSNTLRLWDVSTKKPIAVLRGHGNEIKHVAFSPNGKWLATASLDQTVRLWDGSTGEALATLRGHTGWVNRVAFSPDSTRLVSASQDQTLRLWDVTSGEFLAVLRGHTGDIHSVAYSPDGTRIASGSSDKCVRQWDAQLVERSGVLRGHTNYVYGVAFHPDGEQVASAGWDGTVRLWNATTGQQTALVRHEKGTIITSVAFHPAGGLLATLGRDDTVRLWDTTGRELHRWRVTANVWPDPRLTFNRQGNHLAAGSTNGDIYIWDVESRAEVAVLHGHTEGVRDVAFSPDGRWLASCSEFEEQTIRIWDVDRKEQVQAFRGHTRGVYALAWHGEGKMLASGSYDGTVRLWDTTTWAEVAVLKHGSNVYSLAFSPDGNRLAAACADNTIHLLDVPTRQVVAELRGHAAYVHAIAFSPDGTRLVSGSGDFTVRVWDTLLAQKRATPEGAVDGHRQPFRK